MKTLILHYCSAFQSNGWYLLAVFGLVVFGCTKPLYWVKPNAQPGAFERDLRACQEAMGLPATGERRKNFSLLDPRGTTSGAIEQCLADRGWFLARKPAS